MIVKTACSHCKAPYDPASTSWVHAPNSQGDRIHFCPDGVCGKEIDPDEEEFDGETSDPPHTSYQ